MNNHRPSLLLFTFFLFISVQANAQDASLKEAEKYIAHNIDHGVLTGIYVGYVDAHGQLSHLSMGTLGERQELEVTDRTIFEIGSISKTFTVTLLAILVDHTDYTLQTPIDEFLPDSLQVPTYKGQHITLGHLATHTSGLSRMPTNFTPENPLNPYADYTVEDLYMFLENYDLTKAPGTVFAYSNVGMGLLGHILEVHYDRSYEELVSQYIAKPLAMQFAGLRVADNDRVRFAEAYNYGAEANYWDIPTLAGAGGIRSTGSDMVHYLKAQMGISKSTLQDAIEMTHVRQFDSGEGLIDDIALSWFYSTQHDTLMWHNGGTGGFKSFMGINKELGTGVVVLANGTSKVPDDVGLFLLEPRHKLPEVKESLSLSEDLLEEYTGNYAISPMFGIEISHKGGQLFAQATGQQQLPVFPESETLFFFKAVEAKIEFIRNEQGRVEQIKLLQRGAEMTGNKVTN